MNSSEPAAPALVQSASLPGRRSLRVAVLRATSFSWRRRRRSSARSITQSSSLLACCGEAASQWSKASRTAVSTMRPASTVASLSLVWPWNSGSRMNTESIAAQVAMTSSVVTACHPLLLADPLRVLAQSAQERDAQPVLVRAAVRRRNRVAVRRREAVLVRHPGDGPFERAVPAGLRDLAGEDLVGDEFLPLDVAREIVLQPVRKAEGRLGGHVVGTREEGRGAAPADLDPAEEIGFRARHLEQAPRLEMRLLAEDLVIGPEPDLGAAPVEHAPDGFELALRDAARKHLAVEGLPARDLDLQRLRQGIDDRHADAVQAARGLVDLRVRTYRPHEAWS